MASMALRPCLRAVEMQERSAQKVRAPSKVRKQPETFYWTMIMRTSRSARMLSKGMRKSYMKA